jgi:hypothetical protein
MVMEIAEFLLAIYMHFQCMYYLRMKYSKHETHHFFSCWRIIQYLVSEPYSSCG